MSDFSLADLIVRNSYSYAGVVVHPDETDQDDAADGLAIEIDDVMAAIPSGLVVDALKQALTLAIPAAIREEFTRDRCDTCDTPFLRCAEKAFDAPETTCCGACSHQDTPVSSQRIYTVDEMAALLSAAATGAPTLEEAVDYLQAEEERVAAPARGAAEVFSTAVNIGLTDSRRTLDELRSAAERHPETADLIAAWETAIERLQALAGLPVADRRRTDG